jgi:hypothetical protein
MVEEYQAKLKKYEAEAATVTEAMRSFQRSAGYAKELLISETMLKRITTKESDRKTNNGKK